MTAKTPPTTAHVRTRKWRKEPRVSRMVTVMGARSNTKKTAGICMRPLPMRDQYSVTLNWFVSSVLPAVEFGD